MDVARLYERPLPASRSGPLYNAVSYPTKIAPESVALYIACHTRPGATVLDAFAGSGSTGIATLLCDKPTDRMKELARTLGLDPVWGPRNAVLYELSEMGSLIGRVMCAPPDPASFREAAEGVLSALAAELGDTYAATSPTGEPGVIRYVVWSDMLRCDGCGAETPYFDATVRRAPLRLVREFACPPCGAVQRVDDCVRVTDDDGRRRRVPAWVYGRSGTTTWSRPATPDDTVVARNAVLPAACAPMVPIAWGDLYRAGYHEGITHLHHLYTPRNFAVMSRAWSLVDGSPATLRDALRLLALSYNATHATLMTRVVVKDGSGDFTVTGAQSGVLYVPGMPVEKNLVEGLRRKVSTLATAFELLRGSRSEVRVVTGSSTSLDLPDESVDYVFTDPPFGANIPYAEVNQVNELWLGRVTARAEEAVVSPSQAKDVTAYGTLLRRVFGEVARVLRPDATGTVVFHSAHSAVWRTLADALSASGLRVDAASVLDKDQPSFKQTVATTAVRGDPLILVRKDAGARGAAVTEDAVRATVLSGSAGEPAERLYSMFVGECLRLGVPVTRGAREFYDELSA